MSESKDAILRKLASEIDIELGQFVSTALTPHIERMIVQLVEDVASKHLQDVSVETESADIRAERFRAAAIELRSMRDHEKTPSRDTATAILDALDDFEYIDWFSKQLKATLRNLAEKLRDSGVHRADRLVVNEAIEALESFADITETQRTDNIWVRTRAGWHRMTGTPPADDIEITFTIP